jgi:flavin reductase (DIM6/NTAB) family NADH-FMN oxidoreductase RutF
MGRQVWKPGNMVYPLPAVMVSVGDLEGNHNIITVAWTGTICTNPAMVYISVRPERHSYAMIRETKEFVINLTTKQLAFATDYCGVRSGRDVDKFKEMHLTASKVDSLQYAPAIEEAPVQIACKVCEVKELGSHHMFLAYVTEVLVDDAYFTPDNKFELSKTGLLAYSHGEYFTLGEKIGTFGYSVRKKQKPVKKEKPEKKQKKSQIKPKATPKSARNRIKSKKKESSKIKEKS